MSKALIEGGYVILSRKITESEIFSKPPLYLKVWVYLLSRAQFKEYKKLKKGQLITSIPEIQEACSYYAGYRKIKPTKDQIYQILRWLRNVCEASNETITNTDMNTITKPTMITTTKTTQGILINIDNYRVYQDPKNYEANAETNNECKYETDNEKSAGTLRTQRQPNNINKECIRKNKNDKEGEERKEEVPSLHPLSFPSPVYKDIFNIVKEIGYRTWFIDAEITSTDEKIIIKASDELKAGIIKNRYVDKLSWQLKKKIEVV